MLWHLTLNPSNPKLIFAILVGKVWEMYKRSSAAAELGHLLVSPGACEMSVNTPRPLMDLLGCSLLVAFPYSSAILLAFTVRLLGCPSTQGTAHGSGNFGCLDFPTTGAGASAGCSMTSPRDVLSDLVEGARNVTFPSSSLHPGQSRPQWHQLPCVSPARPQPGELK